MGMFATTLADLIENSGRAQQHWAEELGWTRSYLNKLLKGAKVAGPKAVAQIASALSKEDRARLIEAHLLDEVVRISSHMKPAANAESLLCEVQWDPLQKRQGRRASTLRPAG